MTDELIVEKKSNLLVGGAMWVLDCFGRFSGVSPVSSLLKMIGLCTRRKSGMYMSCIGREKIAPHKLTH